jgi:hypothetical protein
LDMRFVSGNSVPLERTHITADEWYSLRQYAQKSELAAIRASLPNVERATVMLSNLYDDLSSGGVYHSDTDAASAILPILALLDMKEKPNNNH